MKDIKPYILSRPFNGFNIPISIQSIYLKDYSTRNNFLFSLPTVEMTASNCFLKLESNLKKFGSGSLDISIVSAFVLPIDNKQIISKIFDKYKNNKNIKFHILLEKKIMNIQEILSWAEDIRKIRRVIPSYVDVKNLSIK